ncbi:hypothetical protein TH24_19380 [Thalassospira xiamenensis]|nr:hypothetical protein TH24_19380 [Thalassospira xiamenensis]
MTGEVRLVGEDKLNLPGAAGMAGGGSIELWPINGRKVGARAPGVCLDLGGYREVPPLPNVTGVGPKAVCCEDAEAPGSSGLRGLREIRFWLMYSDERGLLILI